MWNSSHTPAGEMETLDCRATPIGLRYSGILGQDVSLLQWLDYSMDPGSSRRPVSKLVPLEGVISEQAGEASFLAT